MLPRDTWEGRIMCFDPVVTWLRLIWSPDSVNQVFNFCQLEELSTQLPFPLSPQLVRDCFRIWADKMIRIHLFLQWKVNKGVVIDTIKSHTASHVAIEGSSPMTKIFQSHSNSLSANSKYLDSVHNATDPFDILKKTKSYSIDNWGVVNI